MATEPRPQRGTEEYARQYLDRVAAGFYAGKRSHLPYPRQRAVMSTTELATQSPAVRVHIEAAIAAARAEYDAAVIAYDLVRAEEQALHNDIARVEREDRWHWLRVVHGVTDAECPLLKAILQAANSLWLSFHKAERGDVDKWIDTMLGSLYTPEMRALLRTPGKQEHIDTYLAWAAESGCERVNLQACLIAAWAEHMPQQHRERIEKGLDND